MVQVFVDENSKMYNCCVAQLYARTVGMFYSWGIWYQEFNFIYKAQIVLIYKAQW